MQKANVLPPNKNGSNRAPLLRRLVALTLLTGVIASTLFVVAIKRIHVSTERAEKLSVTVVDANDNLLRAFTSNDGRWRLPLEVAEVDQRYLAMLMAYEDRRFRSHAGVDPFAIGRAIGLLAVHGRILSGGSTLTMQVARLLDGEHARTASGKLRQMARALRLEQLHTKDEILRLYLRLAPFGGNIEGVRAASLAWFGKEPRRLSIGEAAILVALPQSPESRRPDRNPDNVHRARDRVIDRALAAGVISADDAKSAKSEPVPKTRREFPKLAPHLAEAEVAREPSRIIHRTTLDREVQTALEALVRDRIAGLGPKLSTAMIVVDHRTGHIVAHVGSASYFDEQRNGAIDMTDVVRSPGSTLKPLIYGLAFEAGMAHPETLIEDRPSRFGVYSPKNFDEDFHGTVTIREALSLSLNIPAVKVLASVGPARLVGRMRRIGMAPQLPVGAEPSLAIALGGVGLKLTDLALLYSAIARGGEPVAIAHSREQGKEPRRASGSMRRLLAPAAAWHVGDILKDAPPPASAKGGSIAYKTGTSYGFRDAWAAGFDGRYAIVVWVGRPDGTATPGLTGRTAAAPLLFDAFARTAARPYPLASPPNGVLRQATSGLPPPLRRFKDPGEESQAEATYLDPPIHIAFPPDRAEIETEGSGEAATVVLKADGGALPLTWLVDGEPLAVDPTRREFVWSPSGLGFARISVIDAKGRSDRVEIRLK